MIGGILGTTGDLFRFLWHRKLWWLTPMIAVLLMLVALIAVAAGTPAGPFIYSLF